MCGYTKGTSRVKLSDVTQLVATVWLHFVKFHPRAELDQLRKGLCETLDFKQIMALHSECVLKLLASSRSFDVTSSYVLDLFVVQYSHEGSNNRTKEEAIMLSWYDYVTECQGM